MQFWVDVFLEKRNIVIQDLVLKGLRTGGYYHFLATEYGRNEICQGLAGTRPGFGNERGLGAETFENGLSHFKLDLAELEALNF